MNKIKEFYKKHEGAIWLGIGTIGMATTLVGIYHIGRCDGKVEGVKELKAMFNSGDTNMLNRFCQMAFESTDVFSTHPGECDSLEYLDNVKGMIVEEAGENFDLVGVLAFLKKKA